jgi:hypothetical protein
MEDFLLLLLAVLLLNQGCRQLSMWLAPLRLGSSLSGAVCSPLSGSSIALLLLLLLWR